jgi:hypothetical protein
MNGAVSIKHIELRRAPSVNECSGLIGYFLTCGPPPSLVMVWFFSVRPMETGATNPVYKNLKTAALDTAWVSSDTTRRHSHFIISIPGHTLAFSPYSGSEQWKIWLEMLSAPFISFPFLSAVLVPRPPASLKLHKCL